MAKKYRLTFEGSKKDPKAFTGNKRKVMNQIPLHPSIGTTCAIIGGGLGMMSDIASGLTTSEISKRSKVPKQEVEIVIGSLIKGDYAEEV